MSKIALVVDDSMLIRYSISTVAGRFRITLRAGVGSHTSITRSQISTAKSSSVPVKLSGEYTKFRVFLS